MSAERGPLPRGAGTNGRLSPELQQEHFAGCVYIESLNKALCPDGSIVNRTVFTGRYGGFDFHMDANSKRVTDSPWRAWTRNMAYRCVRVCDIFSDSELPLGAIITREGRSLVNIREAK
jgi:hypothetical protein